MRLGAIVFVARAATLAVEICASRPVEWLADRAIVSYVAHGGRFEDDHLPTQP